VTICPVRGRDPPGDLGSRVIYRATIYVVKLTDPMPEMNGILARADLQASAQERSSLWGFSPASAGSERSTTPWWLWWNILSADAPAVAVVWAVLFARVSAIRLTVGEAAALVLSVWVIYTTDRLLDGWRVGNRAALQLRHLFCHRHRSMLTALVIGASALVLWLMADGSLITDARAGLKLGVILVLYMAGIHTGDTRIGWLLPKEISVGFLFALGVTLPLWSRSLRFPWHQSLVWGFFALLCSLNCLCIEYWENYREGPSRRQPAHWFVRLVGPRISFLAAAVAIGALVACLTPSARPSQTALLAVSAGGLLILVLNFTRPSLSTPALRVLADVALLVPALIVLLLRG